MARISVEERFIRKVEFIPFHGCWEWAAGRFGHGYGLMRVGPRTLLAHRVSWTIFRGEIPAGLYVCHKCDNPSCVNPDHLFLGTAKDNRRDQLAKGRDPALNAVRCKRGHAFAGTNLKRVPRGARGGGSQRRCRECERAAGRKHAKRALTKRRNYDRTRYADPAVRARRAEQRRTRMLDPIKRARNLEKQRAYYRKTYVSRKST